MYKEYSKKTGEDKTGWKHKWCIFENCACVYAFNKDGLFECTAPSDDSMPCNNKNK